MPYGYGNNMGGPAEWAQQQQAKQSDDFNQIIRLFLSLKNAQQEEGWKQKEFGANEKRYADTTARQAKSDDLAQKNYGLDVDKYNLDVNYKNATLNQRDQPKPEATPEKVRIARAIFGGDEAKAMEWLRTTETPTPPRVPEDSDSPGKIRAAYNKEKSIVIGRHQNALRDLRAKKAEALSGWGATATKRPEIIKQFDDAIAALGEDMKRALEELDLTFGQGATVSGGGESSPKPSRGIKVVAGEPTAKGKNGEVMVVRNGKWVLAEY